MTILIPGGSDSKKSAFCVGNRVWSLGRDDLLEKGMATHSSTLAWRILRTEETGGLQSMDLKESDTAVWLTPSLFTDQE